MTASSRTSAEDGKPAKKRGRPTKKLTQARQWLAESGLTTPEIRDILKNDDVMPSSLTVEQIEEVRLAYEERLAIQESM